MLITLLDHSVDFIVVGGVAAVLQGAPINTFDLDVVHSRSEENIERLLEALNVLDGYYRTEPERKLRPQASHLSSPGHQSLMTRLGPLDLLGALTGGRGYEELLPHTIEMPVTEGLIVRVLDLPAIIKEKEALAGEKDRAVLPILRRTLKEQQRPR